MLKILNHKINIMLPISILILIFVGFSFTSVSDSYKKYHKLTVINNKIQLVKTLSNLIHELQIERGLSVGFASNNNTTFHDKLILQRKKTDQVLSFIKNKFHTQLPSLEQLQLQRKKINIHYYSSEEILDYYSKTNEKLLDRIITISEDINFKSLKNNIVSFSNLLLLKETIGIERAFGTEIIELKKQDQKTVLKLYTLIDRAKRYKTSILKHSKKQYIYYQNNYSDVKNLQKITNMENVLLGINKTDTYQVDVNTWFNSFTKKINNLSLLEKDYLKDITDDIHSKITTIKKHFFITLLFNLFVFFIFIVVIILILNLIRNEKHLQSLADTYIISSSTNLKGIIVDVSQAFVNISGYKREELIGKPHNLVRHPDMPSSIFKELWTTIKSGEIWRGEVKNRRKDGTFYWTKATVIPKLNQSNKIIGYDSIRQDISSEKSKEEFMANMSHELRTPLNSIIGFSGILGRKIQDVQELKIIKQIESSAKILLNLINDILDLSKIQSSKFTIEPYTFQAYKEIQRYSKTFDGLVADKDVSIEVNIDKKLNNYFYGDWMRISQIILNLVSNAIKFTNNDGKIIFSTTYDNGLLVLVIKDNGIGMTQEVQDKIFKPFEQADGSTTRKYGGTGLGLSITQNLVELMNGTIQITSQEGVGTTFKVSLPIEIGNGNNIKEDEESYESNVFDGIHILVAEDNATNQMLIQMLLEEFGISCDIANDGVEAVEMYKPSKYTFILMDENMPNMNGMEAMRILKEKYKEECSPIIAFTANTMSGDREKFINAGASDYLSKPVDVDKLQNILKKYANITPKKKKRKNIIQNKNVSKDENAYILEALELTKNATNFPHAVVKKLIVSYVESSKALLTRFEQGLKENNLEEIERTSHDIKSSSLMLNYEEIGELAKTVEEKSKDRVDYEYADAYNIFCKHYKRVEDALTIL